MISAPNLPSVSELAQSIMNELDQLEKNFILVLDDYQMIREKAVSDLLSKLIQFPPKPMHLVISTRIDPSLPLIKLRAKGQMTEVRI